MKAYRKGFARFFKKNFLPRFLRFGSFDITKRQRFIIAVAFLSLGLFFSENLLGRSGIFLAMFLAILTPVLVFVTNYEDMRANFSPSALILPFFYSLSFALFYFLVPPRFLTRITMTSIYAIGLYSLLLCNNIFTVASIRTIGLLTSARTVSFVITLLSYFFLVRVVFSLHWHVVFSALLVFGFSFFLILQSIWTYTLEATSRLQIIWTASLSLALLEVFLLLLFWPSSSTVVAIFLSAFFYTLVGLTHVWFDKRLFRNVLWEYIWVFVLVFCILAVFTAWR